MRLGGHIGKESISVRENTPNSDLWVISIGNALEISMRGDRFDELMAKATAARAGDAPAARPPQREDVTPADVEHSTRRIALASTNLCHLFQTRPNTMPINTWSTLVAAVVEAAQAWVTGPVGRPESGQELGADLIAAVRALEGSA